MFLKNMTGLGKAIVGAVVMLLVGAVLFIGFDYVPDGMIGVKVTLNGAQDEPLQKGVNWTGLAKTKTYSVRDNSVKQKKLNISTRDGQSSHVSVSYTYSLDPSDVVNVYRKYTYSKLEDMEKGFLYQQLVGATSEVTTKYSIIELMGEKKPMVSKEISENFSKRIDRVGFKLDSLEMHVPDLDEATAKAIRDRQLRDQEKEQSKIQAEQLQIETESAAQAQIKKATANAEATILEAEASSKANKLRSESITEEILKDKELDARNKHGWVTIQGVQAVVKDK